MGKHETRVTYRGRVMEDGERYRTMLNPDHVAVVTARTPLGGISPVTGTLFLMRTGPDAAIILRDTGQRA